MYPSWSHGSYRHGTQFVTQTGEIHGHSPKGFSEVSIWTQFWFLCVCLVLSLAGCADPNLSVPAPAPARDLVADTAQACFLSLMGASMKETMAVDDAAGTLQALLDRDAFVTDYTRRERERILWASLYADIKDTAENLTGQVLSEYLFDIYWQRVCSPANAEFARYAQDAWTIFQTVMEPHIVQMGADLRLPEDALLPRLRKNAEFLSGMHWE